MRRSVYVMCVAAGLIAAPFGLEAVAQTAPSPTPAVVMWGPNSDATSSMARSGNTLYLGGTFDYIGPPTGAFAIVDAVDATAINTAAGLTSAALVTADGSGGWFTASYDDPSGQLRVIRHILVNGAIDAAWTAPAVGGGSFGTSITLMTLVGSRLYIAGNFSSVGGATRNGIAALDVLSGAVLPWNVNLPSPTTLQSSYVDSSGIYIFGGFTGGGVNSLAVFDPVTAAQVPFASSNVAITASSGPRVYGRGLCDPQDGRARLCAYDRAGVPLPAWVPPPLASSENLIAVVADAASVYGLSFDGGNISRLHKYDALTGAPLGSWTEPTFAGSARAMALSGGELYLGGSFTAINGQPRSRLAALDAATGTLRPWAPSIGGYVWALAAASNTVAVGGGFASVGGIARKYLAALDLTTGQPTNNAPPATRPVTALTASEDLVVVAEGDGRTGELYAFSATSGTRYPVALPFTGWIYALEVSGGTLFVGGQFAFGQESPRAVAAYDLVNGRLLSWNPVFSPYIGGDAGTLQPALVRVLRARGGRLYVAGTFPAVDGNPRGNGAAFDVATLSLTSWDPRVEDSGVFGLEAWQGRLLISGQDIRRYPTFTALWWVDPATGDRLSAPLEQPVSQARAIARAGDTLIVGGGALVAIDARSGQQQTWPTGITRADSVLAFDDLVIVAGAFNAVNGRLAANLAVFRTAAPAPPRSLTLDVSQSVVALGWAAGGGNTATSYVIEAGTGPGLAEFGRFPVGGATSVAAGVAPGSYALRVFAVGPTGTSSASSDVLFTVPTPSTAPTPPTSLVFTVTAGNLVSLSWAPSVNATTYVIEGGTAAGLANLGTLPTGTLDTRIAAPLPAGTYFLRLRAANRFGVSAASNEVQVVVP